MSGSRRHEVEVTRPADGRAAWLTMVRVEAGRENMVARDHRFCPAGSGPLAFHVRHQMME
jgi:hypothetical protein